MTAAKSSLTTKSAHNPDGSDVLSQIASVPIQDRSRVYNNLGPSEQIAADKAFHNTASAQSAVDLGAMVAAPLGLGLGAYGLYKLLKNRRRPMQKVAASTPDYMGIIRGLGSAAKSVVQNAPGLSSFLPHGVPDYVGGHPGFMAAAIAGVPLSVYAAMKLKGNLDKDYAPAPEDSQLSQARKQFEAALHREAMLSKAAAETVACMDWCEGLFTGLTKQAEMNAWDTLTAAYPALAAMLALGTGVGTYNVYNRLDPKRNKARAAAEAYRRSRLVQQPTIYATTVQPGEKPQQLEDLSSPKTLVVPIDFGQNPGMKKLAEAVATFSDLEKLALLMLSMHDQLPAEAHEKVASLESEVYRLNGWEKRADSGMSYQISGGNSSPASPSGMSYQVSGGQAPATPQQRSQGLSGMETGLDGWTYLLQARDPDTQAFVAQHIDPALAAKGYTRQQVLDALQGKHVVQGIGSYVGIDPQQQALSTLSDTVNTLPADQRAAMKGMLSQPNAIRQANANMANAQDNPQQQSQQDPKQGLWETIKGLPLPQVLGVLGALGAGLTGNPMTGAVLLGIGLIGPQFLQWVGNQPWVPQALRGLAKQFGASTVGDLTNLASGLFQGGNSGLPGLPAMPTAGQVGKATAKALSPLNAAGPMGIMANEVLTGKPGQIAGQALGNVASGVDQALGGKPSQLLGAAKNYLQANGPQMAAAMAQPKAPPTPPAPTPQPTPAGPAPASGPTTAAGIPTSKLPPSAQGKPPTFTPPAPEAPEAPFGVSNVSNHPTAPYGQPKMNPKIPVPFGVGNVGTDPTAPYGRPVMKPQPPMPMARP